MILVLEPAQTEQPRLEDMLFPGQGRAREYTMTVCSQPLPTHANARFPVKLEDLTLSPAVWTSLLKQTPCPELTVCLLPGWTHQDHPQLCSEHWIRQELSIPWELRASLTEGSLAVVTLCFHKAAPYFSKCALLDFCDSIPTPAVVIVNPLFLEMGQKPGLSSSWGEPSEGLPLPFWVYLHINQSSPKKLNFYIFVEAEQDKVRK